MYLLMVRVCFRVIACSLICIHVTCNKGTVKQSVKESSFLKLT